SAVSLPYPARAFDELKILRGRLFAGLDIRQLGDLAARLAIERKIQGKPRYQSSRGDEHLLVEGAFLALTRDAHLVSQAVVFPALNLFGADVLQTLELTYVHALSGPVIDIARAAPGD